MVATDVRKEETGSINLDREILSRDFAQLISVQLTLHNNSLLRLDFSNRLCAKERDGKFGRASLTSRTVFRDPLGIVQTSTTQAERIAFFNLT